MLKQRIITALIAALVILGTLLLFPPVTFNLLIAAIICYGAWEWSRLAGLRNPIARLLYVLLMGFLLWLVALLFGGDTGADSVTAKRLLLSGVLWWLIALSLIVSYPRTEHYWHSVYMRGLMGLLVLIPAWTALLALLSLESGRDWLLILVAVVVLADIGAYFSGKRFGRRKLAWRVSPGKTLEGLAGALLVNLLFALLLVNLLELGRGLSLILLVMLTVAASVVGDLLESMVKRSCGVKDSGAILPGHGGVLDRIDSITAALPVFTFALLLQGGDFLL